MTQTPSIPFEQAIEMGEYDPEFLSQYPEWKKLTKHIQYQYIRTALINRRKQLRLQWAELNNQLDYRLKPHLATAKQKVEQALRALNDEEERLIVEYAGA